jgi:hypothetical protein
MSRQVTAIFNDRASAAAAVDRLVAAGFAREDISALMSDATRGRHFDVESASKAPEGVAVGAGVGGVLGAITAGLVAVGTVAVPGLGLFAAGPIVAALAGAGAGGAAGGMVGGFVGMGMPEHEARMHLDELKEGSILLGVHAHNDRVTAARDILENAGGRHIHG